MSVIYPRKTWLIAKVMSEGYCCIPGYLRLCKARGEAVADMAKNLDVSPDTIWYHARKNTPCQGYSDCMQEQITAVEAIPKASGK